MFPGGNLEMQGRNVTDHNLYNDLGTSTAAFLLVSARYMHFYSATANGFMQTSDISRHNVIATCSPISQRIFCIHHCTDSDYKLSNSAFIILFATPLKNQTSPPGIDPLVVFFSISKTFATVVASSPHQGQLTLQMQLNATQLFRPKTAGCHSSLRAS